MVMNGHGLYGTNGFTMFNDLLEYIEAAMGSLKCLSREDFTNSS